MDFYYVILHTIWLLMIANKPLLHFILGRVLFKGFPTRLVCLILSLILRTRRVSTPFYALLQVLQNYARFHQSTNQSELYPFQN